MGGVGGVRLRNARVEPPRACLFLALLPTPLPPALSRKGVLVVVSCLRAACVMAPAAEGSKKY
jgi:hypothetical protein